MKFLKPTRKCHEKLLYRWNPKWSIFALIGWLAVLLTAASAASLDPPQNTPQLSQSRHHFSPHHLQLQQQRHLVNKIPRGGSWLIPSGWNPFGYKITKLGEDFLQFGGSLDSDVGRLLASLKKRKRWSTIKSDWLEVLRFTKTTQTMRIYRTLKELMDFCVKARLVD